MSSFKILAAASLAASLTVGAAHAADLGIPPPCGPGSYGVGGPCGPAPEFSGWYLRGYIGMTNQSVDTLTNFVNPGTLVTTHFLTFDSSPLFGGGLGYQINNWLRLDGTAEYRSNAHFHGSQVASFGSIILPDDYNASKSEWLFLANAFVDLGTWWHVTPYLGAGIGTSRNTIASFVDNGATQVGLGGGSILSTTYGNNASQWNLAWALYAGLSYQVTPAVALELSYRYVNLGGATTGPTNSFDGTTLVNGTPFVFHNLTSQDVMVGMRWMLGSPPAPVAPLITKG